MPLLPRGNKLDYAPDNIIQASKRLATISLEQMKNPIFDPDQPTLSTLDAERNLDNNMKDLGKKILEISTLFIRGRNMAGEIAGTSTSRYRATQADFDALRDQIYAEIGRTRGEGRGGAKGRPKGAKNKPKPLPPGQTTIPQTLSRGPLSGQTLLNAEPVDRYERLPIEEYSERLASTGQVADGDDEDPEEEDFYPDEEGNVSDIDTNEYYSERWGDTGRIMDDGDGSSVPSLVTQETRERPPLITREEPNKALSNLMIELTRKIRDADILLTSKIKPALQKLDSTQLQTLTQFYQQLTDGWRDFSAGIRIGGRPVSVLNVVNRDLQYGNQIVKLLKEELDKLRMDILITVNSYKQNEAIAPPLYLPSGDEWRITPEVRDLVETGERLTDDGVPAELARATEGAGRYRGGNAPKVLGIPSIWNASVRNCPVKYLL